MVGRRWPPAAKPKARAKSGASPMSAVMARFRFRPVAMPGGETVIWREAGAAVDRLRLVSSVVFG